MTNKRYLEYLSTYCSGWQSAYWTYIRRTSKAVKVESIYDVLTKAQVDYIIEHAMPKPHKCFKNAYQIAMLMGNIDYVEGFWNCEKAPIEHAWNKTKDGHYFDATAELLGLIGSEEYTSFWEGDRKDIARLSLESKVYGDYSKQTFLQKYKETKDVSV